MARWSIGFLLGHGLSLMLPILPSLIWANVVVIGWGVLTLALFIWPKRSGFPDFTHGLVSGSCFLVQFAVWFYSPLTEIKWNQVNQLAGRVTQVKYDNAQQRLRLTISVQVLNQQQLTSLFSPYKRRVRLSWYRPNWPGKIVKGMGLEVQAKLKNTSGYENGSGFNYQQWLTSKGVIATGSITAVRLISLSKPSIGDWVKGRIQAASQEVNHQPFLLAIFLGDKSKLSAAAYQDLHQMGISHLFAISGLHTGLIYLMIFCCLKLMARFVSLSFVIISLLSLTVLWSYVGLISLPISATRAALLISCWTLLRLCFKYISAFNCLALVAVLSFLMEPFAILSASWWLSFSAVFSILLFGHLVRFPKVNSTNWPKSDKGSVKQMLLNSLIKTTSYFKQLMALQLALSLFMLPVMVFWFSGFSLSGLWVNLLAIPWFVFAVVPLTVLAAMFSLVSINAGELMFYMANACLAVLLEDIAALPGAKIWWNLPKAESWLYLAVFVACLAVYRFRFSLMGILALTVLFLPAYLKIPVFKNGHDIKLTILDVGQGTSVYYQSGEFNLLYDLGPVYPSGFSATEATVLPWLHDHRVRKVNLLVISHLDTDHLGDLPRVSEQVTIDELLIGCLSLPLQERVLFGSARTIVTLLWPINEFNSIEKPLSRNDGSCVIKVSDKVSGINILLTGDITYRVERVLTRLHHTGEINLNSEVLLAPHHGSKYSSTPEFIDAVAPEVVVYSSGVNNRFGFPRIEVKKRVAEYTEKQFATSQHGKINLIIPQDPKGEIRIETELTVWSPFWKKQNPFIFSYQIR